MARDDDWDGVKAHNDLLAAVREERERLCTLGRELDDAICDLRNCMSSPLLVELGSVYARLVAVQMKFRAALSAAERGAK